VEQHVSYVKPLAIPDGMHAIKIRFWRHWHGDKERMRQIGYRCRKVGQRWQVWLLVKDERLRA
jgi:hypothetical protein